MRSVIIGQVVSCLLLVLLFPAESSSGVVRRYFLAARDVNWDYAPGGTNLANPDDTESPKMFLQKGDDRIGHVYKKTIYFEYTDATFTVEIPKHPTLGLLGPLLHAEVGDRLEITYFNNASRKFSVHPHGLFYNKDGEGAMYLDGTKGSFKLDEMVLPGDTRTLAWNVTENDAPTEKDPDCMPWLYHSHIDTPRDTSSGVTGILVTCKKGVLDSNNKRTDVDKEMPIFVKNYDESLSWHLEDNIDTFCGDPDMCREVMEEDDFLESNVMRSINGYMYGHLPDLKACVGHKVALYVIGFGNEFDVHSIHFHGQTLKYQQTKGDTVSVYSATFVLAEMTPTESGRWLITDMAGRNEQDGISAFLKTESCPNLGRPDVSYSGEILSYFLSAEEITWDYGPSGKDRLTDKSLTDADSPSQPYFEKSSTRIGGVYKKAVFKQYTGQTFSELIARKDEDVHMGLLGPVLRAEVGDTVKVTLRNQVDFPISLLTHGFTYSAEQEDKANGGRVEPGYTHTYTFRVPDNFLDDVKDETCLNFLYTSGYDPSSDHSTGLVGPILICKKGYKNASQRQTKEFFLLLSSFDENLSHLLDTNTAGLDSSLDVDDADFQESNVMYGINGYTFGNIPGLEMCMGDSASWYVMSMGSDLDAHTLTFDGNSYTEKGSHRDARQLAPGSTAALHMVADNPGHWEIVSHSTVARDGGMYGFYEVKANCGQGSSQADDQGAVTREFFVAAEEVDWDYAPVENNLFNGNDLKDPEEDGNIFVLDNKDFIGKVYKKAVFRGYTDATFNTKQKVLHENILGPAMRVEVGDRMKVTFKNMASRPYSMHSRGVRIKQENPDAKYRQGMATQPGETQVYDWHVPASAGPGPSDPDCVPWLYYSAVDPTKDVNSGLVGGLIVCRRGTLNSAGQRTDVDKELFVIMSVLNENLSWYLEENVERFAPGRKGTDYENDGEFEESNLMHAVNGRLFGNNPSLYMEYGSKVIWYLLSIGAQVDLHTFHLHGHTFVHPSDSHREDVLQLFPGQAEAVEMIADNPGTWLLHCHVLDHIQAGMVTTYTVLEKGVKEPTDGSSPNMHWAARQIGGDGSTVKPAPDSANQNLKRSLQYSMLIFLASSTVVMVLFSARR